jgi:hypothetical protein
MSARGRNPSPETERAVDVNPRRCTRFLDTRGNLTERIERTGIHVPRLQAHDRGTGNLRERVGTHPSLRVHRYRDHTVTPQPNDPERLEHRRMRLGPDDHRDRRRTEQPIGFDVPSHLCEQRRPRSSKPGDMRNRRPRDEGARAFRWKTEQLYRPPKRHLLDLRSRWRQHPESAVLGPRRRQPIGGNRRG